jgi:hypothetical protein
LFAKGDRIPTANAIEILKLVDGFVNNKISEIEFKEKMRRHLPRDFAWPLVVSNRLDMVIGAAGKQVRAILALHQKRLEKAPTGDFLELLDPRVDPAITELFSVGWQLSLAVRPCGLRRTRRLELRRLNGKTWTFGS